MLVTMAFMCELPHKTAMSVLSYFMGGCGLWWKTRVIVSMVTSWFIFIACILENETDIEGFLLLTDGKMVETSSKPDSKNKMCIVSKYICVKFYIQ